GPDLHDRRSGLQTRELNDIIEHALRRYRASAVISIGIVIERRPERVSLIRLPWWRAHRAPPPTRVPRNAGWWRWVARLAARVPNRPVVAEVDAARSQSDEPRR